NNIIIQKMDKFEVLYDEGEVENDENECLDEECSLISSSSSKEQSCINNESCTFECLEDNDCPQGGKCDFNICKWIPGKEHTTTSITKEKISLLSTPTTISSSSNDDNEMIVNNENNNNN